MKKIKSISKRQRFEKVASYRVQKILDMLDSLSNCANKNNYDYTETDVEKMFRALKEKLKDTETEFGSKLNKAKSTTFKF
jgi:hypothetical protein